MRFLWAFLGFALMGIIMSTIRENFSSTVTTIVLVVFVAACLVFDLIKGKRSQDQGDKKYGVIWWIATLLMFLVFILNTFVFKIDPLYNIFVVLIYILLMGVIRSRWKKAETD